jgi:NAD(P)-dependent dehydrogenase (short-subunit alcohol dehydrogenase family)
VKGALAVVTGGTRGIGLACAEMLARHGATVITVARGKGATVQCDLSDRPAVEKAIDTIRAKHGAPRILVNNAGIFRMAPVLETPADDFEQALQVNLLAPFLFIRSFAGSMKEQGAGHIVTIGSIADRVIFPENSAYAASKFGARAMHEVLRAELRGSGVRATLVSPAPVNTEIWNDIDPDTKPGFTPRRDMLTPIAVASAVEFALTRPADVNIDELRLSRS